MFRLNVVSVLALLCLLSLLPSTRTHVSAQAGGNSTAPEGDDLADFGQEVKVLGQVNIFHKMS